MTEKAPIVLFVYNRPEHTRKTLQALALNDGASSSTLYIYADGPKAGASEDDKRNISATQLVLSEQQWCDEVNIIISDHNKGLADSIVEGVTSVIEKYGKVIVLEDDIETAPGFLKFMNEGLTLYEAEEKVMHISGYMFPVKRTVPELFFTKIMFCWGWATWARSWKHFNPDAKAWASKMPTNNDRIRFNLNGAMDYYSQLEQNANGLLKTWAIKWYASIYFRNGLCLNPGASLVRNIGNDGSGENCDATTIFEIHKLQESLQVSRVPVIDNESVYEAVKAFQQDVSGRSVPVSMKAHYMNRFRATVPGKLLAKLKSVLSGIISGKYTKARRDKMEMSRLAAIPRFTQASTNLLGRPLTMIDTASFNFIYQEIFKTEIYKFTTTSTVPYIVDCGANIGLSVIYFKQLYPNAEVIAFEPDEKVFNALKTNVNSFGLDSVTLIKKACWNEETTLRFYSEGADGGRAAKDFDLEGIVEVQTIRLKQYLNRRVDFLKIDIEGAENEVIPDIQDNLHFVERIFVEFHAFTGKELMLPEILAILKKAGFKLIIQHIGVFSPNPLFKVVKWNNMEMQLNIYGYRS